MPILKPTDAEHIRNLFAQNLASDVTVSFFTQKSVLYVPGRECPYCQQTGEILEEVTALSEKLHLKVSDFYGEPETAASAGITRIPAFVLEGAARGKVRYFGIPAGNEFTGLIEGMVDVSKGATALQEETRKELGALTKDVHIQVFVTPT